MQELIIKEWIRSKIPMERAGAQIAPSARTFCIDNVAFYVDKALKWQAADVMKMKGLCIKLPYPVCIFQQQDDPSIETMQKHPSMVNGKFTFGTIAAYTEYDSIKIPAGTAIDKIDKALETGVQKICFLTFGALQRGIKTVITALGMIQCTINGEGELLGDLGVKFPDRVANFGNGDFDGMNEHELVSVLKNSKDARETHQMMQTLVPTFYALSLLNCKNIRQTVHVDNDPVHRGERIGPGGMDRGFRMIDVPLINRIHRGEIPISALGSKKGLHTVRGHFKTFTAEKPLLGRHVGRWWWEDAVRGSAAHGVVEKEYRTTGFDPRLLAAVKGVI